MLGETWRLRRSQTQLLKDIDGSLDQFCTIFQQRVAAKVTTTDDRSGNDHDVSPLIERLASGDERAADFWCFDDDDRARQAADDSIPHREVKRARRRAGRQLADQ